MKELNSEDIINILSKSFGYKKTKTAIGFGVNLSAYDAFIFSIITGAAYLDNKIYPYTPKGHLKIFHSAMSYKMVTGLFENYSLRTTPYYLSKSKPYLFEGDKTIIPVEYNNEKELKSKLDLLCENINTNILILRVETYKKGNGLEPFLEYMTCKNFNELGYVTENQIPLFPTVGSPDFAGFNIAGEFLFEKGFNVIELSLLRLFPRKIKDEIVKNDLNFVVGEAKTSTFSISKQLNKYINTGLFNEAIEIFPSEPRSSLNSTFFLNENNLFTYNSSMIDVVNKDDQKSYYNWLKQYFTLYILSNLSNDELKEYYKFKMINKMDEGEKIIQIVSSFDPVEILKDIIKYIKHGSFK